MPVPQRQGPYQARWICQSLQTGFLPTPRGVEPGKQVWRSTGLTDRDAAVAKALEWEKEARIRRAALGTADGGHVMAYLGNSVWIEADPVVGRVIVVKAPCQTNPWFEQRIRIVRLTSLVE
jgi:hypothetical protein